MKFSQIALIALFSFATAFATARYVAPTNGSTAPTIKETRWEQVKRAGVLRCGYAVWPPFIEKNPTTGKISGIAPDIMEAIGQKLSLKIEWTAEMNWGDMFSNYNRYDTVCMPYIRTGGRARETDFTTPIGYIPMYVFVRSGDTRFDNDYTKLNKPDVKLATADGDYSDVIAQAQFPDAQKVAVTQMASGAQLIEEVASKKADAVVTEPFSLQSYMANNPGKIQAAAGAPIRTLSIAFPVPPNEPAFKSMIDGALAELFDTGKLDNIFTHYETGSAKVLRIAKPYQQ